MAKFTHALNHEMNWDTANDKLRTMNQQMKYIDMAGKPRTGENDNMLGMPDGGDTSSAGKRND